MKATLFEDDIDAYADLIQQNHEYFISNPTIRSVEEQYRSKSGEYQMTFNSRTTIQPTGSATQLSEPSYYTISTIPRISDILGIILFIGDTRTVNGAFDQKNSVSEIMITDHSSHQPLTISAWNDLSDYFKEKPIAYSIFGFTSLRVTSHKGFGLSTTMSSSIITAPTGLLPMQTCFMNANNKFYKVAFHQQSDN
uniref:Uncharacterized protein n=1 Tax=Amaranthus palmeri TaxID=107608 RepID=A0A6C0T5E5_AMAPA|nr:hypothetical protein AP_R.00g000200-v1.0.a3 [Amaranthus palmeri]